MADRFYTSQPLSPGEFTLDGPEAHHLGTVRRFEIGETITLFNGDGCEYPAEILGISKKSATLTITERREANRELPFSLVVASALPKGDRADFLIEKLTELGVTRFIPLRTERSVVLPKEAKIEKFERAVIEASKQCGRNRLMVVTPVQSWGTLLRDASLPGVKLLSHTCNGKPIHEVGAVSETGVVIAIGPEGGFTDAEVELGVQSGWLNVSFGPRILRVETAAIAAAVWFARHQ